MQIVFSGDNLHEMSNSEKKNKKKKTKNKKKKKKQINMHMSSAENFTQSAKR